MTGYIKTHRQIDEHPLLGTNHRARHLFLDILRWAAWKDTVFDVKGRPVTIKRGQLMMSRAQLSERTGLSEQNIRTLISYLENYGIVKINQEHKRSATIITICNYSIYQALEPTANQEANQEPTKSQPVKEEGEEVKEEKIYVNEQPTDCSLTPASAEEDLLGEQVKPGRSKPQPIAEAFNRYNQMAERCGLQQASSLSPKRRTSIGARLREHGLDGWDQMLSMVERSSFLRGQIEGRDFRANLDWLIKPTNFLKVYEGNYGNGAHAASADEPTMSVDELRESLRAQGYTDEQLENLQ